MRDCIEMLVWGDKHDTKIVDAFLDDNIFQTIIEIVKKKNLSILFNLVMNKNASAEVLAKMAKYRQRENNRYGTTIA